MLDKDFIKIAVSGGKGGTGKSTFSILLANEYQQKGYRVILCDCDVECPNLFLLINQKLKLVKQNIYTEFPKLDKTKCKKCGLCVKTCRSNAIFQAPEKFPVFIKELCSACGACWLVCPYKAIATKKEKTGEIFVNKIKENYWLITGVAKAGLEETGPIVAQTKKYALDFAAKLQGNKNNDTKQKSIIIFDTAAGTHCPVIAALLNVDFVYLVTEPTYMGAYDLELILNLCQKLDLSIRVVLNQADLGKEDIVKKIINKFNIKEFQRKIPYSKQILKAYLNGELLDISLEDLNNI